MSTWWPSLTKDMLQKRARFLKDIRHFFEVRQVLEVDMPLLSKGVATDPCIDAFEVIPKHPSQSFYLQTSPEFAMKRLLAWGAGPIYYLGKAFRQGECGAKHNPEFTMLEWYRPHWSHHQLIDEVDTLFQTLLGCKPAIRKTYQACFEATFNLSPHLASSEQLRTIILEKGWISQETACTLDKSACLDCLFSFGIEPHLGRTQPVVVINYPKEQAALAKIAQDENGVEVAQRFEFYFSGVELANGYHELCCPIEQRKRFEHDLALRCQRQLPELPLDENLLEALKHGLPSSAGVALGVDRLLMLKVGASRIEEVLPFSWERA